MRPRFRTSQTLFGTASLGRVLLAAVPECAAPIVAVKFFQESGWEVGQVACGAVRLGLCGIAHSWNDR